MKKHTVNNGNEPKKKISLKRKRFAKFDLSSVNVPLENKFALLDENEADMKEETPKKLKLAPVIVTNHSTNIQAIATTLQIKCNIKIIGIGQKVFFEKSEDKSKFVESLKFKKIDFFTHPDDANNTFKAILSGLPEIDIENITNSLLKDYQLTPIKIVMFNTQSVNKLYLCHFKKDEVNMKYLKEVKTVYHHIVKWLAFKPKRNTPTQCMKCLMYGHGIQNCFRYAVCMQCSGNHLTSQCSVITTNTVNPKFSCFNCKSSNLPHAHKANDPNCPFRIKYETAKLHARNKNKKPTQQLNFDVNSFPGLNHRFVSAPTPPPLQMSFATAAQARTQIQNNSESFTVNNSQQSCSNNNSSNLFTINELTDILFNSINELEKCTSKFDQLRVIANILRNVCK